MIAASCSRAAPLVRSSGSSCVQRAAHWLGGRRGSTAAGKAARQREQQRAPAATGGAAAAMAPHPRDHTTQSNYAEIQEVARHYELDIDFDRNVVEGYAKVGR
jgi:hypothetical protein